MANIRSKTKRSVNLWVTPEEKELLLEAAKVAGCDSVSDFIKLAARRTVESEKKNEDVTSACERTFIGDRLYSPS